MLAIVQALGGFLCQVQALFLMQAIAVKEVMSVV